jgi:phage/conjugal plasmid C-4 type zinc finger TraR family protein
MSIDRTRLTSLADRKVEREMTPCVSDSASRVEQESLAHTLALRELNKPTFESFEYCVDCGVEIPLARRMFAKGITRCVDCQGIVEHKKGGRK